MLSETSQVEMSESAPHCHMVKFTTHNGFLQTRWIEMAKQPCYRQYTFGDTSDCSQGQRHLGFKAVQPADQSGDHSTSQPAGQPNDQSAAPPLVSPMNASFAFS